MSLTINPLTVREAEVLRHTLGLNHRPAPYLNRRSSPYRNHFVADESSADHPVCMTLVERGLMQLHRCSPLMGGAHWFSVTAHVSTLFAGPDECWT